MSAIARSARSSDAASPTGPTVARPAAEDEVVGADERERELRLLDAEQVLDGLRERAVAVLGRGAELAELVLVLRERDPAVEVDLERLGLDVGRGDVRVDAGVDPDRARGDARLAR